jgi:hypothetical protein
MAFVLTGPSSSQREHRDLQVDIADAHPSSVHDSSSHNPSQSVPGHDMSKEKERPRLEIIVDQECLYLKGTGTDVAPALLSGQVALYLAESTAIKEITLQFRGKARLPAQHDSYVVPMRMYAHAHH